MVLRRHAQARAPVAALVAHVELHHVHAHVREGDGVDEKGVVASLDNKTIEAQKCKVQEGQIIIRVDQRYFRPTEVESLLGDPSKAKQELGWEPRISFDELVQEMVLTDLEMAKRDALVKKHGFQSFNYHE